MTFAHGLLAILRRERARLAIACVALLFCTAPTPGDIGGCGQKPAELSPQIFFDSKANVDCQRCQECGLISKACSNACESAGTKMFPDAGTPGGEVLLCVPLVHDGEVCLRALQYASCDDYRSYMNDTSPSVPTECNFCPEQTP